MAQTDPPPGVAVQCERTEATAWADIVSAISEQPGNGLGARLGQAGALRLPMVAAFDFGPFNRTVGLGIDEQADERQVDEVVAFYEGAGLKRFVISLSPFARPPELPEWLTARGLARGALFAKAWRGVDAPPEVETDLRIEVVRATDAADWAAVQRIAWGMPRAMTPWFTATVGRDGWHHYLGFDGETPVAASAMFISGRVGWFGFGATIPTHRRRGGHAAMISRRIRDAAELGCSLVIGETEEDTQDAPNPSYHNMIRAGFRVAYLRPNYAPRRPGGDSQMMTEEQDHHDDDEHVDREPDDEDAARQAESRKLRSPA